MHTSTYKSSKKRPLYSKLFSRRATPSKANTRMAKLTAPLRPLKKINKQVIYYIAHKPYQSAVVLTFLTGIVVGIMFVKSKYFD